jgi:hypothetical protein
MLAGGWIALILIIEKSLRINDLHECDWFVTASWCVASRGPAAVDVDLGARRHDG